ncbi:30S ribosomal subunit protein S18 [Candidatus Tremblaya phenacola PAVE]|nr:30S ribosomal subunit protein S18 [Candidatus Tremblaya phenacola PAVE]
MKRRVKRSQTKRREQIVRKVHFQLLPREQSIDYKNTKLLCSFVTDYGKIVPARISGNCQKVQRKLGIAIKRARFLSLLPFTSSHIFPRFSIPTRRR